MNGFRAGRRLRALLALPAALLLAGCLEVDQHPVWKQGRYDGKPDDLPEQALFSGDRLAWSAVNRDRQRRQHEYRAFHLAPPTGALRDGGPAGTVTQSEVRQ